MEALAVAEAVVEASVVTVEASVVVIEEASVDEAAAEVSVLFSHFWREPSVLMGFEFSPAATPIASRY